MRHRLPYWMTYHMAGIIVILGTDGAQLSRSFIPSALLRLAREGFVTIDTMVRLTPEGSKHIGVCITLLGCYD